MVGSVYPSSHHHPIPAFPPRFCSAVSCGGSGTGMALSSSSSSLSCVACIISAGAAQCKVYGKEEYAVWRGEREREARDEYRHVPCPCALGWTGRTRARERARAWWSSRSSRARRGSRQRRTEGTDERRALSRLAYAANHVACLLLLLPLPLALAGPSPSPWCGGGHALHTARPAGALFLRCPRARLACSCWAGSGGSESTSCPAV